MKTRFLRKYHPTLRGLQWSHVLTNVETCRAVRGCRRGHRASMEPRPHERGNACASGAPLCALALCFNGATSSRTWKRGTEVEDAGEDTGLQWSHVLTNVETSRRARPLLRKALLQWSHVLTNVETPDARRLGHTREELQWSHVLTNVETESLRQTEQQTWGFNRATSSRTWKLLRCKEMDVNTEQASMEPRPHERGN